MDAQTTILAHYSLFLFDFDGLLVDTERLHFRAYQQLCARYNLDLPWEFSDFCQFAHRSSDHLREGVYKAVPQLKEVGESWDQLYGHKKALYLDLIKEHGVQLMPGVAEFLSYLQAKNARCCVVTHSPRKDVEHIRQQHEVLREIPSWLTREDYSAPKPAPDGYLKALQLYLPAGGKAIGFEDSPRGLQSLKGAGVTPVFVSSFAYNFIDPKEFNGVIRCATLTELLS